MSNPANNFPARVGEFIDAHHLLGPQSTVLVAVSGGPDSVALLGALVDLARVPRRAWKVSAAHLDHGLRPEAGADAAFVAELCERLGVELHAGRANVAQEARQEGLSLESAGRMARYRFLGQTARRLGCSHVATGHQADDNVETVLHRIVRGTGIEGLRGIPARRRLGGEDIWLVRPLLEQTRQDVLDYLHARGLGWREDASNAESAFTRNRIRHELLPLLREQFNPQVDAALRRLITTAEWAGQYLDALGGQALEQALVDQSDRHVTLSVTSLARKDPLTASGAVREALRRLGAPLRAVGLEHVCRVLALLEGETSPRQHDLPDGLRARREYDTLVLELPADRAGPPQAAVHELRVPGLTDLPDGTRLRVDTGPGGQAELQGLRPDKPPTVELLDADRLALPLLARHWHEGDRFWPLGARGHRKLSDFLGDRKIPAGRRNQLWIVCDQLGPVWVAPLRIDERVKVTPATRTLARLELLP